jgi:hypothetical protein
MFINFDLVWPYLFMHFHHVSAEEVIVIFVGETTIYKFKSVAKL